MTNTIDLLNGITDKMAATLNCLKKELLEMRGSRPAVEPIEKIRVTSYGSITEIKAIAKVYLGDQCINIEAYDKNMINPIIKAIENENLGFSTQINGKNIIVFFSTFDTNKKAKLIKLIKTSSENTKIKIRNIRHNYIKIITKSEKNGEISENEFENLKNKIEKEKKIYELEIDKTINLKINNL